MRVLLKAIRRLFTAAPGRIVAKERGKATIKMRVYRAATGKWDDLKEVGKWRVF